MTEKRPARIQAEDIDFLISALHRIKNHGGTLEDIMDIDAWFGDTNDWVEPEMSGHTDEWTYDFCEPDISTCMGCHRFPKDGRSLRDALRQLKAVDMVVKAIRKSLSQRLMCMGRKCARLELQDGLQRTPDEVLSVIFQFAYSSSGKYGHRVTKTIASISTRFRDICLQSPGMWSSLSCDMSPKITRLNLARSKASQLSIYLHEGLRDFPDLTMAQFLQVVIPHTSRWSYLDITTYGRSFFAKTFSKYTPLELPKLLYIRHEDPNAGREIISGPLTYFYSKWNMPSLRCFDGYNVVPDQQAVGADIRECNLRWNAWEPATQTPAIEKIVKLPIKYFSGSLRTVTYLQHLTLDFEEIDIKSGIPMTRSSDKHTLSNLVSLTLLIGTHVSLEPLGDLLEALPIYNHDSFNVKLKGQEVSDHFIETFFSEETSDLFHNLKSFTLTTDITMPIEDSCMILESLFTHSLTLRHLSLNAPSIQFIDREIFWDFKDSETCRTLKRSLHTIRFESCDLLTEEDLKDIYDVFLPVGEDLKRLEVINCKLLKEHFLAWQEVRMDVNDKVQLIWEA